ncbi:hypothetical protein RBB75_20460 (plasmid) [Tunturibacter empetritectus]|uniref:Uncharacterized protein n=1 Tax=Tunturiibacter empetritectus TaxID=3069691 RepID=A0AAU7ZKD5_9BACT
MYEHLLSKKIYLLCRTDEFEPVAVNTKVMRPTVKQTKAYLLCETCEDNLNKNGERITVPLLTRFGGPFPLYERLVKHVVLLIIWHIVIRIIWHTIIFGVPSPNRKGLKTAGIVPNQTLSAQICSRCAK